MTRLLVLGNSHVGALRMAKEAFCARYPRVETAFFAAPGGHFLRGRTGRNGVWRPYLPDDRARAVVEEINGAAECDLAGYDAILVIGHRFSPHVLTEILLQNEILGLPWRDRGSPEGRVSRGFVERTMAAVTEDHVDQIVRRIGTRHPFVLAAAPFPSDRIGTRGDEASLLTEFLQRHPATPDLMPLWTGQIAAAAERRGLGFLPQPAGTMSGPAATRAEFAEAAATGDGAEMDFTDHRHMNGAFGLAMLEAWAASLGLEPDQETPRKAAKA